MGTYGAWLMHSAADQIRILACDSPPLTYSLRRPCSWMAFGYWSRLARSIVVASLTLVRYIVMSPIQRVSNVIRTGNGA